MGNGFEYDVRFNRVGVDGLKVIDSNPLFRETIKDFTFEDGVVTDLEGLIRSLISGGISFAFEA